ncbi:unnamed protein product [Microthlaspi erraticum]|uniref:NB-ARC domain-containing protein n=1 Tax=Microthlaspi erraticum TaxID=1685480 RepID=A0A6D2I8N2_9BRAS|nr:unnamed protein product [Microthlaspi erraticum]
MAGELVSFGVQNLYDVLSEEYALFQGVDDQVAELKRDLNLLNSFLKDADAKKHTSALVNNCIEEIKEIVYDAEDIIETYLFNEKFGKTSGVKKRIKSLLCVIPDRREIALHIGGICRRISKVISNMQSFGVQQTIADGGYMQPLHDRQRELRQTFSKDSESDLVGIEENVRKLVGYLVKEDTFQVVSITGMGGVGKTTLSRQVFNHEMVKHHFDGLAWVCVSQDFTQLSVWQTILRSLRPNEEEKKISEMAESTLHDEVFQLLERSKSLIVLDDIWKEEDWDLIRPIFPSRKGCWKVLLTSRNENVAVRGDITYINLKPECLSTEDSWTLFQRIALPKKDASDLKVDEKLEEMGKQMIKHCGGLPLAVKVLGGLLATKYTVVDWERLNQNIRSHILGRTNFTDSNNSSIYHILSMSFEGLPSYLKYCFLYLAHFPEDHTIDVEKLSYYWAAEGLFRDYDGETIRDVGDNYIGELVRRNIVLSERDDTTLRYETCHMHDMMREICLFKAKENFLQIVGNHSLNANSQFHGTSRRFVSHSPSTLDIERDISHPKVRSLLVVWHFNQERCLIPGLSFKRLQLSRLLDLPGVRFEGDKLPSSIGKLIHLRYLSLEDAVICNLPSSLRNLKLLIYLDLRIYEEYLFVPNVLMGMKELRYLALPWDMGKKKKLELSNLVNLETLIYLSTENSSVEDLHGMTKLRILRIRLTNGTSLETLYASISGARHLENLEIMYEGSKRMKVDGLHFPAQLTSIHLSGCGLKEDPMPILEKLLYLKDVELNDAAFCGRKMVCSGGGFPKLHRLKIWKLNELEEWVVEEGSMPLLHTLYINHCDKLKELPDGIRLITSLKELRVSSLGEQWKEKLSEGGEDYYKIQHIPSVTFSNI